MFFCQQCFTQVCQTYMQKVLDGSEGFNEVRDIMDRYDLIKKDEHNQDLIAAERARLAKLAFFFGYFVTTESWCFCVR